MHIVRDRTTLRNILRENTDRLVGFIPTMGALHQGHLSLVLQSLADGNFTVCSIYVNPTQFNRPEDLEHYPRSEQDDVRLLEKTGCHVVFIPDDREMYPSPSELTFHFGKIEEVLEGASRPGHFNGVAIVVSKLFHMINPQKAYFGLKDYQQVLVVKKLIDTLSFDVELIACPTERESDGLAMSSRNRRLTPEQRTLAPRIYEALRYAEDLYRQGASAEEVRKAGRERLGLCSEIRLDYFELADGTTLEPLSSEKTSEKPLLLVAAWLGNVRLIDNLPLFSYF